MKAIHTAAVSLPLRASRATAWAVSLVVGATYGAAASLVNRLSVPADAGGSPVAGTVLEPAARAASLVLDAGWAWAGLAVAAGWLVAGRARGAIAGLVTLLAATAAYFAVDHAIHQQWSWGDLRYWGVASVVLGPALGAVGAAIRRPGVGGLVASLTVPVGAAVQMVVLPPGHGGAIVPVEAVWARAIVLAGAAVAAGLLVARFAAAADGLGRPQRPERRA
ncbi:MAG TPA: hypothetical protein VGW75_14505 [Solirubrobacteraceae bacterium]|jgi:hypothetical protein|nr:hypothetical protein [Solirubrobacteraceae bacterium]